MRKHTIILSIITFILILLIPTTTAQDLSDFDVLTWDSSFKEGDFIEWEVDLFEINDTQITDLVDYGFREGSTLKIEVLIQLSSINLMDFIQDEIILPEEEELVDFFVDDMISEFILYDLVIFLVPVKIEFQGGTANSFFLLNQEDVVFFSEKSRIDGETNEYIESRDTPDFEEFRWDFLTGVLNSINIDRSDGFKLSVNRLIPKDSTKDDSDAISTSGLMISLMLIPISQKIMKRKNY